MDVSRMLTQEEVLAVLDHLRNRGKTSQISRQNLIIFRLSCCCGLRAMEIAALNVGDLVLDGPRPVIALRKETTKGKRRGRKVPLWWDQGTRDDLAAWHRYRLDGGAKNTDPFVTAQRFGQTGQRLKENVLGRRWRTAIKPLGKGRVDQLSIHTGRHSFISHALAAGRSLVSVRDAAGHSNISITSVYLHAIDEEGARDLFPGA